MIVPSFFRRAIFCHYLKYHDVLYTAAVSVAFKIFWNVKYILQLLLRIVMNKILSTNYMERSMKEGTRNCIRKVHADK